MDDGVQLLLLIADGVAAGLCPVADIGLGRRWCLLGGIAEGGQGPEFASTLFIWRNISAKSLK